MSTTPKLIKFSSNTGAVYANRALIQFIKKTIATAGDSLVENDKIYFMKDIDYRRDLLTVSNVAYSRVIKLEKANAIIVNVDFELPVHGTSMKNNRLDSNLPDYEAEDILYNVSGKGVEYLETFQQWLAIAQLTTLPKIISNKDILSNINSGFVIDDTTFDSVVDMIKADPKMAAKMLDNCDIEKSFYYMLYLIHFTGNLNGNRASFSEYLLNARQYIISRGCWSGVSQSHLMEIMKIPSLSSKISASVITYLRSTLTGYIPKLVQSAVDHINIDVEWKQ